MPTNNLPPVLPPNLPSSSLPNIPLAPSSMPRRNDGGDIFDEIDKGVIGEGGFFQKGSWSGGGRRRYHGLQGQLRALKTAGMHGEAKSLSRKNLQSMYDILAPHLKEHTKGSGIHISRKVARKMMAEAEALRVDPKTDFTKYDKRHFGRIVEKLREKDS
ncbi:MAG: hypothetical protein Q8O88_05525 [bacterium]|nr:hypothetical protein [bacterium]